VCNLTDTDPTKMKNHGSTHTIDTVPKFTGDDDADAYLSWAIKFDKIFRMHNYSNEKKVSMASLEFEGYANIWWEQVVAIREENLQEPIATWEEMKLEMHTRFVPDHYNRDLFNKLQKLTQGTKSVEEYFKEMEMTMMRINLDERQEQTMVCFPSSALWSSVDGFRVARTRGTTRRTQRFERRGLNVGDPGSQRNMVMEASRRRTHHALQRETPSFTQVQGPRGEVKCLLPAFLYYDTIHREEYKVLVTEL
jgi:hypothetical protein